MACDKGLVGAHQIEQMVGIRSGGACGGDIIQRLLNRVAGVDILSWVALFIGPVAVKGFVGPLPVVGV